MSKPAANPLSMQRGNSVSSGGSGDVDSVGELARAFASGAVQGIVQELLNTRDEITREAPDSVYLFFADNLPEIWQSAAEPLVLLLNLLRMPMLQRKAGDKVDLGLLLVRALRKADRQQLGEEEEDAEEKAPEVGLTPELTEQARQLCLKGTYLPPRTFEALVALYRVKLTPAELLAYSTACFAAGQYRECADFNRAFKLTSDDFPHAKLLDHLAADKQCMDVFAQYLQQTPEFLQKYALGALNNLAEYNQPGSEGTGGNDPNLAAKLALKFGFPLSAFPRVLYLKKSDILWWITRIGKAADFGLLLAGEDRSLQRKLLKELVKSRNVADHRLAGQFLEHFGPAAWPEHAEFLERIRAEYVAGIGSHPPTNEERVRGELDRALALQASSPNADPSSSLLLPALPAAGPLQLPSLFLRPDAIVFVDSLSTLAQAQEHLLSPECTIVGIDLEHAPENFEGLDLKPHLCQLLQIGCKTGVFLIDMQVLWMPDEAKDERPAAAAADVSAAAAVASSASSAPAAAAAAASSASASASSASANTNVLPPLAPCSLGQTPTTPELVRGVSDLLLTLFMNSDVMKVGIGFGQDLRKMRQSFPHCPAFQCTLQNYYELTPLLKLLPDPDMAQREEERKKSAALARVKSTAKKAAAKSAKKGEPAASPSPPLEQHDPNSPRGGGGYTHIAKKEGGLSKLVRIVLRRHLDKSEQISNWSNRPLSLAQTQYAALDAYVCILVMEESQKKGVELEPENLESTGV